jgi:hypothetical protein
VGVARDRHSNTPRHYAHSVMDILPHCPILPFDPFFGPILLLCWLLCLKERKIGLLGSCTGKEDTGVIIGIRATKEGHTTRPFHLVI